MAGIPRFLRFPAADPQRVATPSPADADQELEPPRTHVRPTRTQTAVPRLPDDQWRPESGVIGGVVRGFKVTLCGGADSFRAARGLAGSDSAWPEPAGWFEHRPAQVLQKPQPVGGHGQAAPADRGTVEDSPTTVRQVASKRSRPMTLTILRVHRTWRRARPSLTSLRLSKHRRGRSRVVLRKLDPLPHPDSVRSKSRATWPMDRSARRHSSTISALSSGVNERRCRGFFNHAPCSDILPGANPLLWHQRRPAR